MGVMTKVDWEISDLKMNIYNAVNNCNQIMDADTWGYSDLRKGYLLKINEIRSKLQEFLIELDNL